jgi:hypothetical protein
MVRTLLTWTWCLILVFALYVVLSAAPIESQATPNPSPCAQRLGVPNQEQSGVEYWDKVFDILAKLVEMLAIGGGAIWAYYKFIKGRVYRPRLKLSLHASNLITSQQNLLLVSLTIENVGLSVVKLQKKSMLVRVLLPEVAKPGSKARKIEGKPIGTFRVFQDHALIESSETIGDELTLSIPSLQPEAIILQFRVVGWITSLFRKRILEWWKPEIVEPRLTGMIGSPTNPEREIGTTNRNAGEKQ